MIGAGRLIIVIALIGGLLLNASCIPKETTEAPVLSNTVVDVIPEAEEAVPPSTPSTPHPGTVTFALPENFSTPEPFVLSTPAPASPARLAAENKIPHRPFPQHVHADYAVSLMMPTNKTQDELDDMIIGFFEKILRRDLIVDSNSPANKDEFRLIFRHYQSWALNQRTIEVSHLTVSESHGYGMMMLAYMAGSEDRLSLTADEWIYGSESLKDYFDAMLRTVLAFPSVTGDNDNVLFAWELNGNPADGKNRTGYVEEDGMKIAPFIRPSTGTSATDGDMDIIYALLLADKQWGSEGIYDYKQIALNMLASFWQYCVNKEHKTLLLGDWASSRSGSQLGDATRPSDFIMSHLKAFAEADPSHDWQAVINATYGVIAAIRDSENALGNTNGLLPDFVVRGDDNWLVPEGYVLEGDDHTYAYNACRVPWRLGTDYLLYGDTVIGESSLFDLIIKPIDEFAQTKGTLDSAGPLKMDGTSVGWADPHLFGPPFIVTAAAHGANQDWVNRAWGWYGLGQYQADNYADYIKMLVMLTASGNYWRP